MIAYLGLGASLGDRLNNLNTALGRLRSRDIHIRAVSPVYESPHLGLEHGDAERFPAHLNIVIEVETTMLAEALLDQLQEIETAGERQRHERWAPRTIDIDILDYDGRQVETDRLTLPHSGIATRAFVARPLLDLTADFRLRDGTKLRDLLAEEPLSSQQITKTRLLVIGC